MFHILTIGCLCHTSAKIRNAINSKKTILAYAHSTKEPPLFTFGCMAEGKNTRFGKGCCQRLTNTKRNCFVIKFKVAITHAIPLVNISRIATICATARARQAARSEIVTFPRASFRACTTLSTNSGVHSTLSPRSSPILL